MKKIIFLVFVTLFIPLSIPSAEILNSVYVEGIAPINVDGDLSDWDFLPAKAAPLTNLFWNWWNAPGQMKPNKTPEDLSGSFKCFFDSYNFYVSMKVNDDHFISGREPYAHNFYDDCVEIVFNGDANNWYESGNFGLVRIFAEDKTGKTLVETRGFFPQWQMYPCIWEELGLRAGLKRNDTGYTVEAAIPCRFMGWEKFDPSRNLSLEIQIFDTDNKKTDCAISWGRGAPMFGSQDSPPPNYVNFSAQIQPPNESKSIPGSPKKGNNENIFRGTPEQNQLFDQVTEVYRAYSEKDYETTERLLRSGSNFNKRWQQFFLGNIMFDTRRFPESAGVFSSLTKNAPDNCFSEIAVFKTGRAYMRAGEKIKALDMFRRVLLKTIDHHSAQMFVTNNVFRLCIGDLISGEPPDSPVLKKKDEILADYAKAYCRSLDSYPVDDEKNFNLIKSGFDQVKAFEGSIILLDKMSRTAKDPEIRKKAKFDLARCSYAKGDVKGAEKLANELLKTDINAEQTSILKSLLESIEVKKKLEKDSE
jgi:tetratricopeptide (TPR) repeat protein